HKMNVALKEEGCEVDVISPRVLGKKSVKKQDTIDDIRVRFPKYLSFSRYFLGLSSWFAWRSVAPIINDKEYDLILAHTAVPDGYIAKRLSKRLNIPYFVYVHGADVQHKIHYSEGSSSLIRAVLISATKVFVNSSKTKNLVKNRVGVDAVVIPMGVDGVNDGLKKKKSSKIKIISICNLEKEKGIQYSIEAVKGIKDENLEYFIIGSGSYEGVLQKLAKNDHRISFLGRLSQEDVFGYLASSDIFVMRSYNEAFGVVYIEAMNFGLPIIGVKGEGVEDIIEKGECGILVEPRSADAVGEALIRLMSDERLRANMGKIGQKIVKENYLWSKTSKQILRELA
ncbi:MAG: glycosyltransferase, partial [Patescibacteria group bacterium]|nr:glycosyltransferase [Patescibacteria group bacterium]